MANVLLVYPNIWSDVFPLSILTLSAVLKAQGHRVDVFSAVHRRRVNSPPLPGLQEGPAADVGSAFRRKIDQVNPHIIAFSVVEDAFPLATLLLDALHDRQETDATVIVGGVFATFAPDKVMAHRRVDAVCIGEGEYPLAELCTRIDQNQPIHSIAGLWVRDAFGMIRKNPRPQAVQLDALPTPDYSILDRRVFQGPVPIIPHRGCPYPCTFCNSPAQATLAEAGSTDRYFRKQSMALLARDLHRLTTDYADKLNESGLYFCSDTLLAWSPAEFDAFIEMYADFQIPFVCHTTPETLTESRLARLVDVGLKLVNVGIQHGNELFRRDILKRRMTNRDLLDRFAMASESGAWISADFIMGFPLETPALARDTIQFSRQIRASVKNCSVFVPYHGTALRQLAVAQGFLDDATLAVWSPLESQLSMPEFSRADIHAHLEAFRRRSVAAPASVDAVTAAAPG